MASAPEARALSASLPATPPSPIPSTWPSRPAATGSEQDHSFRDVRLSNSLTGIGLQDVDHVQLGPWARERRRSRGETRGLAALLQRNQSSPHASLSVARLPPVVNGRGSRPPQGLRRLPGRSGTRSEVDKAGREGHRRARVHRGGNGQARGASSAPPTTEDPCRRLEDRSRSGRPKAPGTNGTRPRSHQRAA